jgi:hypothetical protein
MFFTRALSKKCCLITLLIGILFILPIYSNAEQVHTSETIFIVAEEVQDENLKKELSSLINESCNVAEFFYSEISPITTPDESNTEKATYIISEAQIKITSLRPKNFNSISHTLTQMSPDLNPESSYLLADYIKRNNLSNNMTYMYKEPGWEMKAEIVNETLKCVQKMKE